MLQQPYDFVLMNVQVPEMNGFEVTAVLRAQEQHTGGHIPVVAMMANTMEGDQERCPTRHPQAVGTCAPEHTDTILSWKAGLSVVEGDEELYRELLVIFRDSAPMQLENLREALRAGNVAVVEREAHSLKSAAANIGARAVSETARNLEFAAKQHDIDAARCFSDQLRSAFQELLTCLDASVSKDDVV